MPLSVLCSLLILLEPVLNPVWTFLFAGEQPGPWTLLGGGTILLATAWRTLVGATSGTGKATSGEASGEKA